MTPEEFTEWFAYHTARFTGIRQWLDKSTKGAGSPSVAEIQRGWYGTMRNLDLDNAKAASDRMHAGDIEEPKGYDRHPAAIRRACAGLRKIGVIEPRYDPDGNETFACLTCMDTGMVFIWHPKTVMQVARDGFGTEPLYSCAVACTCKSGDAKAGRGAPRYDGQRYCKLPVGGVNWQENQDALMQWIATHHPTRPANYEPAFDEPSGSQSEMEF